MANRINYTIGYTVDKTGLQQLQNLFQTIAFQAQEPANKMNAGLQQAGKTATQLDAILEKCFNQDLGTLNVTRFNQELKKANLTTTQIKADLAGAGATGSMAFNNLGSSILKTNIQLKQTNKLLDSMAVSMANTVKWGITSSIFNTVTSSISKSVNYAKQLDKSLNNIRIVTGKSKDEMAEFAVEANNAAKSLGASTLDYTNASLIYAQQGLSDAEVKARAEVTVKAANVTGQTGEEVSEQLTAVWNGYKVTAAEAELYVDKLAAVAASTAADLEELSTGMSKVAAAANSMGVDIDQLNAQLSTIISVTRQAPESAGTALKTIYARMADLKLGETDEDGVDLGYVSAEMTKIGVNVLDANGNLKDMGDVVEEVAEKWDKLSKAQQVAIASAMAGKRQYNNLIALFDNWDMYTEALETSQNAMGTLQEQQDIYTESTAAKLKELKATWEDLYGSLIDNDELNTGIDGLKNLVQIFDNFIDSFGGGIKAIGAFGIIVANIFNKQIANAIIHAKVEQQKYQNNMQVLLAQQEAIQQGALKTGTQASTLESQATVKGYEKQLEYAKQIYMVRKGITSEQYNEYMQDAAILKQEVEKEFILRSQMEAELLKADFKSGQIQKMIEEMGYAEKVKNNLGEAEIFLDEQVDSISTLNTLYDKNLSFAKKRKELEKFINENNKKADTLKQNSLKIDKRVLNNLKNTEQVQKAIIKTSQQILDINEKSREKFNQQGKAIDFIESKMNKYADVTGKVSAVTAGLNTKLEQAKVNVSTFSTIGKILPTLSTFAMAWSSVSSAIQTVTDDTASFGDKVTQIMMMLGMTLPMMTSAMQSLSAATGYEVTLTEVLNAKKKASLALDDAQILASNKKIIVRGKELIGTKALAAEMQKEATAQGINVALLGKEEKLRIIRAAAQTAGITLTKAEEAAILEATAAQNALNASMLANPWVWAVGGIAAVVAGISAVVSMQKKAIEAEKKAEEQRKAAAQARIEDNNKIIEQEKQKQQEIESNRELYKTYTDLVEQYNLNKTSKEELDSVGQQLIDAYNIENGYLMMLAGNYELLTEKINEKIKAQQKEKIENAKNILVQTKDSLRAKALAVEGSESDEKVFKDKQGQNGEVDANKTYTIKQSESSYYGGGGKNYLDEGSWYEMGPYGGFVIRRGAEYETDVGEDKVAKRLRETGLFDETVALELGYSNNASTGSFIYNYGENADEDIILLYETFTNMLKDFINPESEYYIEDKESRDNNEYYQSILRFVDEVKPLYDEYKQAVKDSAQAEGADQELLKKLSSSQNFDEFSSNAGALKEELKTMLEDPEYAHYGGNLTALMKDIFAEVDSKYKDEYLALQEFLDSSKLDEKGKKELEEYFNTLDAEDVSNIATLYVKGYLDENSTKEEIISQLEKMATLLPYDVTNIELTASLSTQVLEGKIDEETIKQLREYNNGEYENQLVDFENKSLKEQLEILKQITEEQQKENAIAISGAESRRQAKIDEIQAEIDLKEAKKEVLEQQLEENPSNHSLRADIGAITSEINNLQQILDEGVDFDIDIDTSALDYYESKVQTIVSYTDLLQNSTALIGEGWKVAQEDVAKFAQMYPELMRNAEVLETGELQLNEAILKDKLGLDEDIINSDTETTAQQLKNQMAILKAQLAYTETKRDILKQQLQGEINQSEAEKALEETETKYANEMNQIEIKDEQAAGYQIINDAANTSTEVQNHLHNIALKASQVGSIIIDALSGKKVDVSGFAKIFSSEISKKEDIFKTTGSDLGSTEEQIKAARAKYTEKEYQKIVDEFNLTEDELDRLNNLYGDYATILSKLYANRDEAIEGISNAVSGKGNKEEDKDERDAELKKLEDEFDRYWDLNNAIDATSKALENLSETQDKLTRGELQDNLKEQNELLEQQIVNYQNLRKEQEKEAGELKGKLLTFGVDFNADGSIANYAEATQEALNYYNNAAKRYNTGTISEEDFEIAEKSYEEFKETLERYDSLYYDEMVETAENIADTQREILENNLQDFELSITIKTDAAEFDREVKDFETEIAKDFTKAFEDIDSIIEKSQFNVESYGESFNAVAAGISKVEEEILKLHNGENSDMFSSITEAQEKLKELNKEAMEHASNMKAAYEEAWEAYLEGIDQSQEKFDELQEKYSKINEELEYQKELIELIYGPKAYDLMDKFYEKQKENSLSQIKSLQYEKELWLSKYDAEAAKAGDEDQLKIAERISQIQSDLNSNVTSYIQLLKDEYANTISGILSKFESQLTNGSSLDDIAEEWERLTENSDKYFNNVEGLYETQTLANKIKDSINDTINIKNQEKLQALYDREIEYLREKENLTQYDLDAAEARYQIALKEIALEEARANKNSMRLTRDANGNWSYQYVADENNIAEKQQELSDAMYKFYELSDKAYKENLESIQKLNQKYFDKAEEIATNELLTEQEKELKLEELRKWYLNQYQLLVSENEIIRQNLANGTVGVLNNLYNQDAVNFENMTLQEQAALTQVKTLGIESFAELEDKARQNIEGIGNSINIVAEQNIPEMTSKTQELADTWGADDGASVKVQSLDALNSMMEASEQYRDSLDEIAAAIKEDWGPEGITGAIDGVSQAIKDVEEATKKLCANTEKNLTDYQTKVNGLAEKWDGVKTAIKDSIKELNTLYKLQGNPPPKVDVPDGTKEEGDGGGFANVSDNIGGGGGLIKIPDSVGGGGRNNPPDNNPSIVGYLLGADLQASPGGNRKYDLDNGKEYSVKAYDYVDYGKSSYAPYPIRVKLADDREGYVAPGSLYSLRWGKNGVPYRDKLVNTFSKVGSFDTGGYTGEWGSDGRMAMLHEKELVLNKEDTSNILAAVNGIRQLSSIESAISKGIASMIMNMAGMGVNANYNTNEAKGNQTEQVFNITAEFPNANNVSEIREAILSLPGLASQQVGLNLI